MTADMTIGSLFSGIGGLDLGLERAGVGRVAWQVEIDPFCRRVLAKHWPEARRYDDVRGVGRANLALVDVPADRIRAAVDRIRFTHPPQEVGWDLDELERVAAELERADRDARDREIAAEKQADLLGGVP